MSNKVIEENSTPAAILKEFEIFNWRITSTIYYNDKNVHTNNKDVLLKVNYFA